jgi:hypothetical protein
MPGHWRRRVQHLVVGFFLSNRERGIVKKSFRRAVSVASLGTLTCLALVATAGPAAHAAASGATGTGSSGPTSADASYTTAAASPRQQAEAVARAILQAFVPPPGATRQAGEPASAQGSLDSVGGLYAAYEIQKTSWWLAPGQAAELIAWETAHLPAAFTPAGGDGSSGGPGGISVTGQFYQLPPQGVLVAQDLVVSVADLGGGNTAIRVDAEVAYQPVRPAGEKVPARAKVVTITAVGGYSGTTAPPPVTITTVSVVQTLVALVNGLQLSDVPPDAPCPANPDLVLELTFQATAAGPPLAVAEGPGGCDTLTLTVNGKQWPLLALPQSFTTQVLQIAGLDWTAAS